MPTTGQSQPGHAVEAATGASVVTDHPAAAPVKVVILPRTRAGLDRAGLRRHLETVHAPMVLSEPEVSGPFSGYVHHYTQEATPEPVLEERDAIAFIRFADSTGPIASKSSEGYRNRIGPDEDNFSEADGSIALTAREWVVVAGADDAARKLFVFRHTATSDLGPWARALANIAEQLGLHGVVTNTVNVRDGAWQFTQFDEIGLEIGSNMAEVTQVLETAAQKILAPSDTRLLLTEPVRFI